MRARIALHIVVVSVAAAVALATPDFQRLVHPLCPADEGRVFERIQDITALLHGPHIAPGVCIFNPSVTRLQGDLLLWAARAYTPRFVRNECIEDPNVVLPPITNDGWSGTNSLVLAVTRTTWNPSGDLSHTVLGVSQVDVPMEDGRLFKDGDGAVWLLMHMPRGGYMSVSAVEVTCDGPKASDAECNLELGGTRVLWFKLLRRVEKNWVPHNGTGRMTYPHFPAFGPHSVLDFGSYQEPVPKYAFDHVAANETFFSVMYKMYPDLVSFAGSTPAVLHDDGSSYVAVGHVRSHSMCWHNPCNFSAGVQMTCEAFAARTDRPASRFFHYEMDGQKYSHHFKEYAFFFYRFEATPPYEITHISHGFIPCSHHHSGVTFPAGIERIGPNGDFLIAYGEANRYSRLLTISAANLYRLLLPEEEMRRNATTYRLCSIPCS